jgi:hypothetical protein
VVENKRQLEKRTYTSPCLTDYGKVASLTLGKSGDMKDADKTKQPT